MGDCAPGNGGIRGGMLLQLRIGMSVQRIVDFRWRTYVLVSVPRKGGTRIFLRVGVNILGRLV